jgi:hypothetical protein
MPQTASLAVPGLDDLVGHTVEKPHYLSPIVHS